jgi:hypothetical protein
MVHDVLKKFKGIVAETEFFITREIKGLLHYKCKIQLIDGSNLRISETRSNQKRIQYSYYWLDEENDIIVGWDNAPHHPQISTYPHHKHVQKQDNVLDSKENSLDSVLNFITTRIS